MMVFVAILIGHLVAQLAFVLGTVLTGRWAGLVPSRLAIGIGPALIKTVLGGVEAEFRLVPIGAAVAWREDDPNRSVMDGLSRASAAVVGLAGLLAMVLAAVAALGTAAFPTIASVWTGVFALLNPANDGMRAVLAAFASASPLQASGMMIAGNAAVNLLPVAPLPAGMVLRGCSILSWHRSQRQHGSAAASSFTGPLRPWH